MTCSPGNNPHADRPNFTLEDYLQMCSDGEAKFSLSEAARVLGWSRALVNRALLFASIPDDELESIMDDLRAAGKDASPTAIADEIRRRTGRARAYVERCPHCGGELRTRHR